MEEKKIISRLNALIIVVLGLLLTSMLIGIFSIYLFMFPENFYEDAIIRDVTNIEEVTEEVNENGIHAATGLKMDDNLDLVINNCTNCHSAKLIAQNKASKEGWKGMIRWMQKTQNLWDLGENEEKILEYLAKNYAPEKQGRRKPLTNIEWYELE